MSSTDRLNSFEKRLKHYKMGFGNLKTAAGLNALNDFLADKSYIDGYTPSQADVVVFQALSGAPSADLCHALRWYNQIKSYTSSFSSLPGIKKPLDQYGPAGGAPAGGDDDDDDDDDDDLFGSDEEDEAVAEKVKQARIDAYNERKANKKQVIPKSNIIWDVKPWEDTTDMKELEELVRKVEMDGLAWGASKLVPLAYGIKKLQITCVIEDDKVSTEELGELIAANESHVQSADIAAFNKI